MRLLKNWENADGAGVWLGDVLRAVCEVARSLWIPGLEGPGPQQSGLAGSERRLSSENTASFL